VPLPQAFLTSQQVYDLKTDMVISLVILSACLAPALPVRTLDLVSEFQSLHKHNLKRVVPFEHFDKYTLVFLWPLCAAVNFICWISPLVILVMKLIPLHTAKFRYNWGGR
jgi:hypothetical protein